MANYTIKKRVLMRGDKGDTGGGGIDTTVPQAGIIAYKGDTIPEGYILYSEVPDGVLTHITATYTQTATITDASSLDDLRPDLVVKAFYYDEETGTTSDITVTDYTLSGTLEVGTSTITASYKGFSDSFDVTVEESIEYLYKWDFTQSLTDEIQGQVAVLYNGGSQSSAGVLMDSGNTYFVLKQAFELTGKTVEIDFAEISNNGSTSLKIILLANTNSYLFSYQENYKARLSNTDQTLTYCTTQKTFNNITMKAVYTQNHLKITTINANKEEELFYEGGTYAPNGNTTLQIGRVNSSYPYMLITGVRIYANQ